MSPKLPPPDPNEAVELAPSEVTAPTAVFVRGPVSPETDRAADRFLDLRPGLLVVFAT